MYKNELKVAKDIARQAGDIIMEYFDGDQELAHKADGSVVTIADKKVNSMVIAELQKHFDDGIIGEEESTADFGSGRKWFCDPIDGTKAFVIGVPTAMFSLALVIDGSPVLGIAYNPFLDHMYWGIKGHGSYRNNTKIKVSKGKLKDNYVLMSSSIEKLVEEPDAVKKLAEIDAKPTSLPGAVFKSCLVAQGKVVGYFEPVVYAHDMAAVDVIITEAGGMVTSLEGKKLDYTKPFIGAAVSNKVIHSELLNCLK
ncbi:MAG TPA: inositol monophosphatase [Patescibacteria group bacterium]|nr:inositol monophosphatase [Patescibacteria group bacterium]